MIETIIFIGLIALIISANLYNKFRLQRKNHAKLQKGIYQLSLLLSLIQNLQRHRGVCANLDPNNRQQQQRLSAEINSIWDSLISPEYDGNQTRLHIQKRNWEALAAQPENSFMPHCQLIEMLLNELNVIADTCSLTSTQTNINHSELWQNLLERPMFAESLGKLRALGNKAASLGYCPADIRVQLHYQLQCLANNSMDSRTCIEIKSLIEKEILEPEKIHIEPRVYFQRMTQAIDAQIQITLEHLNELKQVN